MNDTDTIGEPLSAVVLSSGANLGAAQVGMLQALVEARTPIYLLVGTSVCAFKTAWMAGHPGPAGVDDLFEVWSSLRRRDDFSMAPWRSAWAIGGRRPSLARTLACANSSNAT